MMIVISPAKTLDFERRLPTGKSSQPRFLTEAATLNHQLRALDAAALGRLMTISPELAALNVERNRSWMPPFTRNNARQAVFAFRGDVYQGLDIDSFSADELTRAQQHLRILSGLYGLLRPLDLIQPYRLEMGTALRNPLGANLYAFWGDKVTTLLNKDLRREKDSLLVNLASQEYAGVLRPGLLDAELVTPVFRDLKNGQYKIISFFAKKARGTMAAWILRNRIVNAKDLRQFAEDGYRYSAADSTGHELVFLRD